MCVGAARKRVSSPTLLGIKAWLLPVLSSAFSCCILVVCLAVHLPVLLAVAFLVAVFLAVYLAEVFGRDF